MRTKLLTVRCLQHAVYGSNSLVDALKSVKVLMDDRQPENQKELQLYDRILKLIAKAEGNTKE